MASFAARWNRRFKITESLLAKASMDKVAKFVSENLVRVFELRNTVSRKSDGSPVSKADVFLEEGIRDLLRGEFEDLVFIGEESFTTEPANSPGWIAVLDPIDGTENFISGSKLWGISLSLWHGGGHAGSMLLIPELGERISSGDSVEHYKSRIIGFSSSISKELLQDLALAEEARISGCAVFNMVNVIRGTFSEFNNPVGAHSWDLLAGLQLALEHNCEVEVDGCKYNGDYLRPGRKYRIKVRQPASHNLGKGCEC
jgi:myo-inositol-1(or 4)-monophosphatase